VLLACALLATLAGAPGAFASTTDELRGEWDIELKCECILPFIDMNHVGGTALISSMNQETGEFLGTTDFYEYTGKFIEDSNVSENKLQLVLENESPVGTFLFVVTEGVVAGGGDEMSGPGAYYIESAYEAKGSFVAKKIRSWEQIEKEKFEREGREKGEKEGRERGEPVGRAKGEQEGREKAEQEVKSKAAQEAAERSTREAQAKTEQEAKEKAEKEAADKALGEAREKGEKEGREKIELEAKQKAKEAKQKVKQDAKGRRHRHGHHTRRRRSRRARTPMASR
jgi:hypothetical protein